MARQLGLDVGGTSTRWTISDGTQLLDRGEGAALPGPLLQEQNVAKFADILKEIATNVGHVDRVAMGITGVRRSSDQRKISTRLLSDIFDLTQDNVIVLSDIELMYLSYFPAKDGILVYAGTGSVALFPNVLGVLDSVGGRGHLLGDEGGAYSIGLLGLKYISRSLDENVDLSNDLLALELLISLEMNDWQRLNEVIYSKPGKAVIARCAIAVSKAARLGSIPAQAIVNLAAEELIRITSIALNRSGRVSLVFSGGVITGDLTITSELLVRFGKGAKVGRKDVSEFAAINAVEGFELLKTAAF